MPSAVPIVTSSTSSPFLWPCANDWNHNVFVSSIVVPALLATCPSSSASSTASSFFEAPRLAKEIVPELVVVLLSCLESSMSTSVNTVVTASCCFASYALTTAMFSLSMECTPA